MMPKKTVEGTHVMKRGESEAERERERHSRGGIFQERQGARDSATLKHTPMRAHRMNMKSGCLGY